GQLYAVRVLLGIAEAGFFPGIMLFLTWWLPRAERVRLIGVFLVAIPLSSAVGAPLSTAIITYLDGFLGLEGWRVMFLLEGVPAVVLGVICWFYLTDRPEDAAWLTPDERRALTLALEAERAELAPAAEGSPWRALLSGKVLALGGIYFGVVYGLYALSFFGPTMVAGFSERFDTEFSLVQTGAIVAVPFVAGAIAMVLWSRHSDRTGERRWHLAGPAVAGGLTIPVALYVDSPYTVMLLVTVTAIGIFCALPVFWHFPPTVLTSAGAAAGIALINTLGNASGFLAPYVTGWARDATGDLDTGLWIVGIVMVASGVGAAVLREGPRARSGETSVSRSAKPSMQEQ
ncbi:MFS transporter, partial [Streptomyces sp. NPDC059900]